MPRWVTFTDHADKWRVDLTVDPPMIQKFTPLRGWHDWEGWREHHIRDAKLRRIRDRIVERAQALDLG